MEGGEWSSARALSDSRLDIADPPDNAWSLGLLSVCAQTQRMTVETALPTLGSLSIGGVAPLLPFILKFSVELLSI